MTGLDIEVGQKFVRKRRAYGERRVIEITRVEYSYVTALGWWQERTGAGWVDGRSTRRRTRMSRTTLRAQYERLEES